MTRSPVLHVPAESLISELQRVEKLNGWVRQTLASYETVHLCYEELFDEAGDFHPDVIRTIAAAAGTEPASYARRPLMLKQAAVDFLDGVSNREELKARLAGTRYGWMVGV